MATVERARLLALKSAMSIAHVLRRDPGLLDTSLQIALNKSPSASFTEASTIANLKGLLPSEALGYAKMTRWLAVARRDAGPKAARDLYDEIKRLVIGGPQQATGQAPSIPTGLDAGFTVAPGIYKHGSYDWLAEARLEKLNDVLLATRYEGLPPQLAQLAIDVFHSLYLLDTTLAGERVKADERLKRIAEFTKPLRENEELRSITVLDETASLIAAAAIIAQLEQKWYEARSRSGSNLGFCQFISSKEGAEALKEAMEKVRENLDKEALKTVEAFSRKAGVGHKMSFQDKIRLYELLRKYKVFTRSILEAVRSVEERPGRSGGTIEFKGYKSMEELSELQRAPPIEYAYPESLLLQRIATKSLRVREYREGARGRRRKFLVLIDKSGSMGGEKIEKAKAVAVSLLLRGDVDDVKIAFFDNKPWPPEPIALRDNPVSAIEKVVSVTAGGGTNIDEALEYADKNAPGYDVVIITDGEDRVSYEPKNRVIAVMVDGHNEELKKRSEKYVSVRDILDAAKFID